MKLLMPLNYISQIWFLWTSQRAVAAGAFGYVLKPFSGPGLKAAIETALHKYQTEIESRRAATRAA